MKQEKHEIRCSEIEKHLGKYCFFEKSYKNTRTKKSKCIYTCCACYFLFFIIASAISQMGIGGNRRLVCQKAKRTEVNGGVAVHLDH